MLKGGGLVKGDGKSESKHQVELRLRFPLQPAVELNIPGR